jgi:hypothetical protein
MHTYQADREKAEKDLEQIDDNDDTDSDVARELEMFAGMSHAFFDNNEDVELRPVTEEGDDREARGSTSSVLKAEAGDADGAVVTRGGEPAEVASVARTIATGRTVHDPGRAGRLWRKALKAARPIAFHKSLKAEIKVRGHNHRLPLLFASMLQYRAEKNTNFTIPTKEKWEGIRRQVDEGKGGSKLITKWGLVIRPRGGQAEAAASAGLRTAQDVVLSDSRGDFRWPFFVCSDYLFVCSDHLVACVPTEESRLLRKCRVSKETYYSVKRDLLGCQKGPTRVSKETY